MTGSRIVIKSTPSILSLFFSTLFLMCCGKKMKMNKRAMMRAMMRGATRVSKSARVRRAVRLHGGRLYRS